MATMVEAIQNAIIPEPEAEAQPGAAQLGDTAIETQLTEEISTLWSDHVRLSANHKTTAKELRQIRVSLAERLYAMKTILSRPGRAGQWRGWLRQRGIPRSTADRLASRHAETLCADDKNCPTGAISETAKPAAEKLAKDVWPRFRKILNTHESVVQFLGSFAEISGVAHEWREEGLMIFNPVPEAADGLPGSAIASPPTDLASQPSDGDHAEERAEEAASTPTVEPLAGAGDGNSGEVI